MVEFAGNAFSSFSLSSDVKLYTDQNPDNPKEWTVLAVVPVRKETEEQIASLALNIIPLDDQSIRVRDGFVLGAEDLENLIAVYNSAPNQELTLVFSWSDSLGRKYFSAKEASQIVNKTKGVRMDINAEVAKKEVKKASTGGSSTPTTVDGICRKHGINGLLSQYDKALKKKDKKRANELEDKLWALEKQIKNDKSLPKKLRKDFVDYLEDKMDEIEDRY